MEHYCCKCLVNKVANEGDVCASCGGNAAQSTEHVSPVRPVPGVQDQHTDPVNMTSRRRIITGPSQQGGQTQTGGGSGAAPDPVQSAAQSAPSANVAQPVSKAAARRAAKKQANAPLQGVIQNFDVGQDDRSFLNRVTDSLFKGISYNGRKNLVKTEFQLYDNWNSGYSGNCSAQPVATRVICYGKISSGRPVENNDVRVYGVRNTADNYYIAERIENTTDGTFATFTPRKTSATVVRLIAVGILFFLISLFSGISLPTGGASLMPIGRGQLIAALIVMLCGVVSFFAAKNSLRPNRKLMLYGLSALLMLLGVFILTLQDAQEKIGMFGDAMLKLIGPVLLLRMMVSIVLDRGIPNPRMERFANICIFGVAAIGAAYIALRIFLL